MGMSGMCYLSMGMVVLLMGLVFASVYIYRYFFLAQVSLGTGEEGSMEEGTLLEHSDFRGPLCTPPPRYQHPELSGRGVGSSSHCLHC